MLLVLCTMASGDSFILLPGKTVVWENMEHPPAVGASLKGFALSEGYIVLKNFELRAMYSFAKEKTRMDLSWPGFAGFLSPGVSIEVDEEEIVPWFYGELDLFYMPFAFVSIILFQEPLFIPSVYLVYKFGPAGNALDTGIRVSIPINWNED